jgi:uncharacterized repeat protein (TIGR01451 family)
VTCTQASLVAGASGTITIIVTIDAAVTAGTVINNTATITSDAVDANGTNNSATASVTAQFISNLAIDKDAAPNPVEVGTPLTYTITVTASGPSPAPNAVMNDLLPAGTTFTSLVAPAGWSCTTPAVGATGTVNCTIASLPSGYSDAFTLVVTVDANLLAGVSISNTATIAGDVMESSSSDNSSTVAVLTSNPNAPLITGTKSVTPNPAAVGQNVTYTIVLHNGGTATQLNNPGDEFVDVLPASLLLVSAIATDGTPVADVPNNTVHWNGSIAAGADVTITITATVLPGAAGTNISNQGTIHFDGDNNGTNESTATTNTSVLAVAAAGVPTLSPALLIALALMLSAIAWRMM